MLTQMNIEEQQQPQNECPRKEGGSGSSHSTMAPPSGGPSGLTFDQWKSEFLPGPPASREQRLASSAAAYRRRFVAMEGYEELTPAQIADKAW